MCDAWWPALAALQQAEQQGLPLPEALDKAVAAAAAGTEATIQMQARKGAPAILVSAASAIRMRGHLDPAAADRPA